MKPSAWPRWTFYALAVALSATVILLRQEVAVAFDNRPLLVVMVPPIIAAAALGGLGPGLLATALVAASAAWFFPPAGSFALAASHDLIGWGMLILDGVLVSILSEVLHRSIRRERERRRQLEAARDALRNALEEQQQARLRAETAAAKLRDTERRLHDIVDASADWIWETDADARLTFASDSVERLLGYSATEILGKTPFDLMPPGEAERVRAEFAAIAARRAPFRDLDNINRHKDGSLRHIWTNGMPILDAAGNLLGYRGLDRDISERKQAELELRSRNEELERFNRASVGRELDMIEMKKRINALSLELGRAPPYDLAYLETPAEPQR